MIKITDRVRKIMSEDPKTRNSDLFLILQTLKSMGLKIEIDYNQLKEIPSFETITRCRRHIQNTEKVLLPTIKEVALKRRIKESEFREYYGRF